MDVPGYKCTNSALTKLGCSNAIVRFPLLSVQVELLTTVLNKADDKTAELYINLFGQEPGSDSGMIALKQRVKGVPFKFNIVVFERIEEVEMVDVWYVAKCGQGLFLKAVSTCKIDLTFPTTIPINHWLLILI